MATQATDSDNLSNLRDSTATIAEKIAINKSIIFGEVLAKISVVSTSRPDILIAINQVKIDKTTL